MQVKVKEVKVGKLDHITYKILYTRRKEKMKIVDLIESIQDNLSDDLLKPTYKDMSKKHKFYGHCYVASETFYHLTKKLSCMGYPKRTYKVYQNKDSNNISHWWLADDEDNIIDITKEQYTDFGVLPPYKNGKRKGFLTKSPSKRSQKLIKTIMKQHIWCCFI